MFHCAPATTAQKKASPGGEIATVNFFISTGRMLAVYLFRATSGAHHQEGLVMTLTASSSSRAVTNSPVVVALDYHNRDDALAFVDKIDPRDCRLKVGKEMFTLFGPQFVRELQQRGFDIFLDLKFHDIPQHCSARCRCCS